MKNYPNSPLPSLILVHILPFFFLTKKDKYCPHDISYPKKQGLERWQAKYMTTNLHSVPELL